MDGAPSHTFQSHFLNPNSHFPAIPITEKSVHFASAKKHSLTHFSSFSCLYFPSSFSIKDIYYLQ